jgi:hypothetical protein
LLQIAGNSVYHSDEKPTIRPPLPVLKQFQKKCTRLGSTPSLVRILSGT